MWGSLVWHVGRALDSRLPARVGSGTFAQLHGNQHIGGHGFGIESLGLGLLHQAVQGVFGVVWQCGARFLAQGQPAG
jgi:hypothetical protein